MDQQNALLTIQELASSTFGELIFTKEGDSCVYSVATDSRNVQNGSAFFPLIGEFQDGHNYIQKAVENGASVIVACKTVWNSKSEEFAKLVDKKASVILVDNTLLALQQAAAFYVQKFPRLIRVGITGSNGKTTTKELVSSVLETKYSVIKTEGNFNSETGLPLSVFNIRQNHEVGVFEMGMNRVNEIKELANVLFPQFAIITNIGTAHIGILGTKQNIANEKKQIFSNFTESCVGFVPETDDFANFLQDVPKGKVETFGEKSLAKITNVKDLGLLGTEFCYDALKINLHLSGKYNFTNALSAIALAEKLGLSASQIKAGIEKVMPLGDRSNVIKGKFTVVKDCYNANADSMSEAVKFYGALPVAGKKTFILGDMLELGEKSVELHENVGRLAVLQQVDTLIFVGSEMKVAYNVALQEAQKSNKNIKIILQEDYSDSEIAKLTDSLLETLCKDELFLIKGSRGIRLERIAEKLVEESA